jgi:hypothetical protein
MIISLCSNLGLYTTQPGVCTASAAASHANHIIHLIKTAHSYLNAAAQNSYSVGYRLGYTILYSLLATKRGGPISQQDIHTHTEIRLRDSFIRENIYYIEIHTESSTVHRPPNKLRRIGVARRVSHMQSF